MTARFAEEIQGMKNAEKYLKLYREQFEESFRESGSYYPPRNWGELSVWENKIYEEHLSGEKDDVLKTKLYVDLLGMPKVTGFGFYIAFQTLDCALLNNVLYQTSRQRLLEIEGTDSGTDHSSAFWDALNSFACNDFEVMGHFFPKSLPYSKGRYYAEVSTDLLTVLYYNETEMRRDALAKAEGFLTKKSSSWDRCCVQYLVALIDRNAADASRCLQEMCAAYQKIGDMYQIEKCFASRVHGLYHLARRIDEEVFKRMTRPCHPSFSEEFELWQAEHGYPKGELFYRRPPKLDYMNRILEAQLPIVELHEVRYEGQRRSHICKNTEKFNRDLTENVHKLL
jgi:hypothetical protein